MGAGASEIGTMNVVGSRRSGARMLGSQNSGRSQSDNRSNIGVANAGMGNSGTTTAGPLAGGMPTYSQHMGSRETDLNFMGTNPHASEQMARSSYGQGGGLGGQVGIGQLNPTNLGGLNQNNRRSMGGVISDAGSVYGGQGGEDDAISQFMGASEYGGGQTDIGGQSLIGG
jgi:hypothetical protein